MGKSFVEEGSRTFPVLDDLREKGRNGAPFDKGLALKCEAVSGKKTLNMLDMIKGGGGVGAGIQKS